MWRLIRTEEIELGLWLKLAGCAGLGLTLCGFICGVWTAIRLVLPPL